MLRCKWKASHGDSRIGQSSVQLASCCSPVTLLAPLPISIPSAQVRPCASDPLGTDQAMRQPRAAAALAASLLLACIGNTAGQGES